MQRTLSQRSDFARNFHLLCSYCRSVTAVGKDLGISRQQLTKYLSGKSTPSIHNLRKICDYFGLEETEILLPHQELRGIVSVKPPQVIRHDPLRAFVEGSMRCNAQSAAEVKGYLGFYYSYFIMRYLPDRITRALLCLYEQNSAIFTKNVERFPENSDGAATTNKYNGVVLYDIERLFIYEREAGSGNMTWQTVVYASNLKSTRYLTGLTMGIVSDTVRDIACYRVVYEYLGKDVNPRHALGGCGTFALDSPKVPRFVRDRVINDMRADEHAFMPR